MHASRPTKLSAQVGRIETAMNTRFDKLEAGTAARFDKLDVRFADLLRHIDQTREVFRSEFRDLIDAVQANAAKTDVRFEEMMRENRRGWDEVKTLCGLLAKDHASLEARVSRIEDRLG